jgi:filamentous hemagglutinin family protein
MKKIIAGLLLVSPLFANPGGPTVVHGVADFIQKQNTLEISCSNDLIVNWKSFSLDKGERVAFIQPSSSSFALNRVIGIDPSHILGSLTANGALFLLNPNGILIGEGAKIDVGSLVASTLDLKDEDFLSRNFAFSESGQNSIVNIGEIQGQGDVYLLSSSVDNQGTIVSQNGKVGLGAGDVIVIKPSDKTSLYILPGGHHEAKKPIGLNLSGEIRGSDVELKADGSLYELAINQEGSVDARSIRQEGGEIYLTAENGKINIQDGCIASQNADKGGRIEILGNDIHIDGNTAMDVSHPSDGGSIYIGGGRSGKTLSSQNAETIYLGKGVVLDASSQEKGNGGEIVVWSDGKTSFWGQIYSTGGALEGDGGFVEISGRTLVFEGKADLRAPAGKMGELLLDPYNVTIGSALADTNIIYSGGNPNTATPTNTGAVVGITNLNANLNTANVVISTFNGGGAEAGTITVNCSAGAIAPAAVAHGSLTLRATSNILFGGASTITFQAAAAATFNCIAGDPLVGGVNGDIQFNANLTLNNALSANFTSNGTGVITTAPVAAAKTITFAGVPTINMTGAAGIVIANNAATAATMDFGAASTAVNLTTIGATADIILGGNGTAVTALLGGASTVLTATSSRNIIIAKGGTGAMTWTTFRSASFNAPAGTITTQPPAAQTVTCVGIPTYNFTARDGITIGNNNTVNAVTIAFGVAATAVNMTTTGAAADINFGHPTATNTGITTLTGGASTVLTATAGRNILFLEGTGAYNFTTFNRIDFLAPAGQITMTPWGAVIQTFTGVGAINYTALNSITLGQNATGFAPVINFGNPSTINMTTTAAATDIVLGGAGAGAVTFNGSVATTLNVNPTGKIVISGTAGISTFSTFGTINFFSASAIPTASQLVELSRPTVTFNSCDDLMMYPYNINFLAGLTTCNITSSTVASITTIDPAGTTIPTALAVNANGSNFAMSATRLTVNGRLLNSAAGTLSLTTTTGDITVQAVGILAARVGTNVGDLSISTPGNLNVIASNGTAGFAQIGYDSIAVNSDIYLTVGGNVNITGGTVPAVSTVFALIGHGAKTPLAGSKQGNIIINSIGGDLNLTAGAVAGSVEGAARLGHMTLDTAALVSLVGDIRGPTAGSYGVIGGNINLIGGIGDQCMAQIGHGASSVTIGGATISGNILLQCNDLVMTARNSLAGTENFAGIGHKVRFAANGLSSTATGSVDVHVLGNALLTAEGFGGAVLYGCYINNGPGFTSSSNIDLTLVNLTVDGFVRALGATTVLPQENKLVIGVYSDIVASYSRANLNISTGGDLTILSRNGGDYTYVTNGQTVTPGRTLDIDVGGNMNLWAGGKSAIVYAIDTLNLFVGIDLNMEYKSPSAVDYTSIESNNTLYLEAGGYIDLTGYNDYGLGDVGFAVIRNDSAAIGDVSVICGRSLTLNSYSRIENHAVGLALNIVNDNAFPTPPAYGSDGLDVSVFTYMTTAGGGPLRIYTSTVENDDINIDPTFGARFNGNIFVPGPLYVDSATEIWGTYYPSSLGGVPYTIFYKDRAPVPPIPGPPINQLLQEDPLLLRPYYEMFHKPFAMLCEIVRDKTCLRDDSYCAY